VYTWELRAAPRVSAEVQKELQAARKTGDSTVLWRLRKEGKLPGDLVQSGSFVVERGAIVPVNEEEKETGRSNKPAKKAQVREDDNGLGVIFEADQVIPDDLIVQGSGCFGFDCVNNESFGFDTIRMKENNTRIKFEDTSVGAFPTNDWQLTANDSASGGASKFSIEDITGAKVPFTVTAGASTNSIFVDSTGRVGFRTSTPVLDLHINTSNTPALRMEQNNSGGFTAQTWDIAGNEANFFVRDVTGGSRLPFRIRPGAPTSSLDISADGDVGVGTASPDTKLHVLSSGALSTDGKLLVENTSGTALQREMAEFRNNGGVSVLFEDTSTAPRWVIGTNGNNFIWNEQANPGIEMTLSNTGNLTITGVYSPSDRGLKKDIVPVRREVLAKLAAVPISTWTYKTDEIRHMGPMAQDFSAAFGLGIDDKHVSPMDMAGVSLAAVQALNEVVQEKDKEIGDLRQRNTDLEKRLSDLEALVANLAAPKQ
ncbi:MAG TPA: tail fiber domain-containing protein, partial [Thermoanaerobaculia bacterium]|nr:tail fiber domain-containing protein [Thermoanaerobaculia bacterium]